MVHFIIVAIFIIETEIKYLKFFLIMFRKKHFTLEDIPDLTGRVAIVTGGNTGIGYAIAKELSRKNAYVFVASRNKKRGEDAVEKIKKETGNNQVEYLYLD